MTRAGDVAKALYATYEDLAPNFGYQTRKASTVPWEVLPSNKNLMIATVQKLLDDGVIK